MTLAEETGALTTDGETPEQKFTRQAREMWDEPLPRRTRLLAAEYGIHPSKRLGQSFLINDRAANRLADIAAEFDPPGVTEVGGGLGALTVPLIRRLPRARFVVYEVDPALCRVLADLLSPVARRCWVHCRDFIQCSGDDTPATDDWVLVGNLPYSVTTPILERIFTGARRWRAVLVMVQREFAERMAAGPGSRTYGALSVFSCYHCQQIERVMDLSPGSFWPKPKVASVAVLIRLRPGPPECVTQPVAFRAVVRAAFGYRRKTLLRGLSTAGVLGASEDQVRAAIALAGLDPQQRAETVSFEQFAALADSLARVLDWQG